MCSIREFQKRLKDVNLTVIARDAVQASKTLYMKEQKDQMFNHKKKDGLEIKPRYSPEWREFKMKVRGQDGLVTLYNEGNFYGRFRMTVKQTTFVIESTDWKNKLLQHRYGKTIFGLGGKYKREWIRDKRGGVHRAYYYIIRKALQLQ
jgi:hypothetical protein